jgi:threonine/homoserine/homoserine lactone efflux protein
MKLSAPKQITFWVAVIVEVIGLIAALVSIPVLSGFALWILVLGFIVLAVGNLLEGF